MAKTKWSDGVAFRGGKIWIRAKVKGDREQGAATDYVHLLKPHEPVPTTITDGKRLKAKVVEWVLKGRPMPEPPAAAVVELTGKDLFDRWLATVEPFNPVGKKKSVVQNWESKLRSARVWFDPLPLSALSQKATMTAFVHSYLERDLKVATPQRILATIVRPAVLWGSAQRPPLIVGTPFGKYGYKIDLKKEDRRTGRIAPPLEHELLDICELLNVPEREMAGGILADFLTLAIDTGGRHEYFLLQNKDVDWSAHKLALRQTKLGEPRFVPFNPKGRVADILKRRRFAGAEAYVLARPDGSPVVKLWKTWVEVVCLLKKIPYVCTRGGVSKETSAAYKACKLVPYLARHEAATWWGAKGVSDASAKFLQGHSSQYDTHGRYKHEQYAIARRELAEKVWPCEHERAQPEGKAAKQA